MLKDKIKPIYRIIKIMLLKIKYFFLVKKSIDDFFYSEKDYILFITHSLKGGTYQYERNLTRGDLGKKIVVLRIVSYGKDLCYKLENKDSGRCIYISPKNLSKVFNIKYQEIIINSLFQIYDLFNFIDLLIKYKSIHSDVKYTYLIHDFHCVCPNQNLIAKDWYCDLKCKEHNCLFDKFIYRYDGDIGSWRKFWTNLLFNTDRIICFSQSSKKILSSVYPNLDNSKIIISPHDMSYSKFSSVKIRNEKTLNVGIIGACNHIPKGKKVIERLFNEVSTNVLFSMIGTYKRQFRCNRDNTFWYGKYRQQDLQSLIEKAQVNLVVFPSVWPETFSYLISELIQMDIPIICFDMGAQREKMRLYDKGHVCKDVDEMVNCINSWK